MTKASEAVEKALRDRFDFIDIGQLHDDDVWQELSEIAAQAAIDSLFPKDVVVACRNWRTNADLVYDAWRLGYAIGHVYDMTPGDADALWARRLVKHGEHENEYAEGVTDIWLNWYKLDFRNLPHIDAAFDAVFYDPPYKLNGNPDGLPELSARYGVDVPEKWQARHELMVDGFIEALRVSSKYVLVKCQDQVVSGHMRWQTDMFKQIADGGVLTLREHGLRVNCEQLTRHRARLVDRFDMIGHHIPQPMGKSKRYPNGRKQKHAHARPSTLLIFQKT